MKDEEKVELYRTAIDKWGKVSQAFMVMEEVGEMLDALGKAHRGRLEDRMEIITELADVTIMMEQWAAYFGWDEYLTEKERKLERLKGKVEHSDIQKHKG